MSPNRATALDWSARAEPASSRRGRRSRPELSRQAIVQAALRIADSEGLRAVTIRRVASELDVRPMSLYTHIAAKADLLSLMADELAAEMLVEGPMPADWRQAVSKIAGHMHASFVAHPWFLEAFAQPPQLGPNVKTHIKQQAAAMAALDIEPTELWTIFGIVNDYVLGHALRVRVPAAARPSDLEDALSPSDLGEQPALVALPSATRARHSTQRFEIGLQAVLDGIERRFLTRERKGRRHGSRKAPPADDASKARPSH